MGFGTHFRTPFWGYPQSGGTRFWGLIHSPAPMFHGIAVQDLAPLGLAPEGLAPLEGLPH